MEFHVRISKNYLRLFHARQWDKVTDDDSLKALLNGCFKNVHYSLQRNFSSTTESLLDIILSQYNALTDNSKLDFIRCFPYFPSINHEYIHSANSTLANALFQDIRTLTNRLIPAYRTHLLNGSTEEYGIRRKIEHIKIITSTAPIMKKMPKNFVHAIQIVDGDLQRLLEQVAFRKNCSPLLERQIYTGSGKMRERKKPGVYNFAQFERVKNNLAAQRREEESKRRDEIGVQQANIINMKLINTSENRKHASTVQSYQEKMNFLLQRIVPANNNAVHPRKIYLLKYQDSMKMAAPSCVLRLEPVPIREVPFEERIMKVAPQADLFTDSRQTQEPRRNGRYTDVHHFVESEQTVNFNPNPNPDPTLSDFFLDEWNHYDPFRHVTNFEEVYDEQQSFVGDGSQTEDAVFDGGNFACFESLDESQIWQENGSGSEPDPYPTGMADEDNEMKWMVSEPTDLHGLSPLLADSAMNVVRFEQFPDNDQMIVEEPVVVEINEIEMNPDFLEQFGITKNDVFIAAGLEPDIFSFAMEEQQIYLLTAFLLGKDTSDLLLESSSIDIILDQYTTHRVVNRIATETHYELFVRLSLEPCSLIRAYRVTNNRNYEHIQPVTIVDQNAFLEYIQKFDASKLNKGRR
ncbi:unnamed protein product [Caenorhabditis sp. 36 PRJEB53466]|nr:unnamed protein product [Caenorhabditis sp. 36 PRJEB53466]